MFNHSIYRRDFVISTNTGPINLYDYFNSIVNASNWSGRRANLRLIINSGVYLYSTNTTVPALTIDNRFRSFHNIEIVVDGAITGAGGVGGLGGTGNQRGNNGGNGGHAIVNNSTNTTIKIRNNGGIYGGGGGGGGGAGYNSVYQGPAPAGYYAWRSQTYGSCGGCVCGRNWLNCNQCGANNMRCQNNYSGGCGGYNACVGGTGTGGTNSGTYCWWNDCNAICGQGVCSNMNGGASLCCATATWYQPPAPNPVITPVNGGNGGGGQQFGLASGIAGGAPNGGTGGNWGLPGAAGGVAGGNAGGLGGSAGCYIVNGLNVTTVWLANGDRRGC